MNALELESKPGPISQILINLIMNSLIHAFDHKEQGTMTISVTLAQIAAVTFTIRTMAQVCLRILKNVFLIPLSLRKEVKAAVAWVCI